MSVQKIVTESTIECATEWWLSLPKKRQKEFSGHIEPNKFWRELSDTQKFQTWWFNN